MTTDIITFNGKDYKCRVLKDSLDGEVTIGSTDLIHALQPDGNDYGEFASDEAQYLDSLILFYTDAKHLELPDDELIAKIIEESPELQDWFD